ncbi:MAG: Helix-turn-helix domain [Verrucomicrobiota bacterium]|jgi:predicted transcriptional regulator
MTSLLPFLASLNDIHRLRLLQLLQKHKPNVSELRAVLGLGEGDLAAHLKQLVAVGLIKTGKQGAHLKIKHKHAAIIAKLFAHFKVGSKKDEQTRADEKKLHALRHPKTAKKPIKAVAKKKAARKK